MNLLVAENISKSYTDKILFNNISLGINENDRIGLIGINGTGKSTLLKIIAGVEEADSGSVITRNGIKISYLAQTPVFDDEISILENVTRGLVADEEYRNIKGEAEAMLKKLGIADVYGKASLLSGGQRKRASLVRTLLTKSDILVLDEPTNHLDSYMTEWLEDTLNKYKGAYIMITHDRYFLDEVTNRIIELDKGSLYTYDTNYSGYVELKAEREASLEATERKNKSLYKQELAWMLRGARARSTKQKAHIERFKKLRDRKIPEIDNNVQMLSAYSRLGKKTVEINNISKAFDDKVLIKDFSYIFLQNDRIGIIGPNGCGKSTLLNILTGKLTPDSGVVEYGITVKLGIFSQECSFVDENIRVIDYIREEAEYVQTKDGTLTASKLCENFLFEGSMQYQPISKLSGGEKRRLFLLRILISSPNILVLDEPTNDLDIKTLTILEEYLQSFDGIVIAVSHDRYFLDKIVNRIFAFQGNGKILQSEGNYTDYRNHLEENGDVYFNNIENKNIQAETKSVNKNNWKNEQKKTKLKFSYAEQKEFDTIDEVIAKLEEEISDLEKEIEASSTDYYHLNELMKQKQEKEELLEEKMDRWVYLNDLNEQIQNQ